ncbi:unnamed protein product [Gongylonema pulchrum]|uniref:M20_dimer domain-containing protein n=1 Tax=Gongylonema pulchrum TaxID=637853 RepID=A0A183D9M2_9BILA|nr:unnamed protein product [Gongylonema pulchrum]
MMSQLSDVNGNIKIDGLLDLVAPVTDEERRLYKALDFDMEDYRSDIGAVRLISDQKEKVLMNRWRNPSLSLHGIEGAFSGEGAKTIIPSKVIGKFSIRLVPNMEPAKVDQIVLNHLNALWKKRGSPNHFR